MAKEDNLKPNTDRTPTERKELARKAGIASGKARLVKKTAQEYARMALEGKVKGKDGKEITIKDAMIQKLIAKAVGESDLNSIKYILELIGENPTQRMELTGKNGSQLIPNKITHEEAKNIIATLENGY